MSHRTRALSAATVLVLLSGCTSTDGDPATSADAPAQGTAAPDPAGTTTGGGPRASAAPDTAAATTEAPPAAQGALTSTDDGFTVELPQEWSDATTEAGERVLLAMRADERTDRFFTNLVVVPEEPIADLPESMERTAKSLAGADGDYELLEPTDIDGEPAYGYTLARTVEEVEILQVQRYVERDGVLYILTMSSALAQQERAQDQLQEILGTWAWQ